MFITKEELQTAIYESQVAEIMEGDTDDIAIESLMSLNAPIWRREHGEREVARL